jgi:hypothetical protein
MRPVKPDVVYLTPAFEWAVPTPLDLAPEQAPSYLLGRKSGHLVIRRIPKIRVYLHSPWHQTGIERLGVVGAPSILNTIRAPAEADSTHSLETDGGALSPNVKKREPDYSREPLANCAITEELLSVVSRWGFDPVWNDRAFSPLCVDDFESRAEDVTYERIDLVDIGPGSLVTAPPSRRHVWNVLHYDGAKDRWYADLRLSLRDVQRRTVKVDPAIFCGARAVVLSVNEYEIFPAADASLDEGLVVIDDQLCARRVVYSYSCEIGCDPMILEPQPQ